MPVLRGSTIAKYGLGWGQVRGVAQVLDGRKSAGVLKERMRADVARLRATPGNEHWTPGLAIVQVGDRADSNVYIKHKLQDGAKIGIDAKLHKMEPDTSQSRLLELGRRGVCGIELVEKLNADNSVDGIIVQLPLETSETIDTDTVIDRILPRKDVDGLTRENAGRLARGELDSCVIPCTPRGCLHLVEQSGVPIAGSRVVVLGRSRIVGAPAAALFTWNHGTVTIGHSKTQDLAGLCREADILIVAIGKPLLVKGDWIKPGAVVVDCGINVVPRDGKNRIVGDVDYQGALEVGGWVTPVPGGVGPMTVAMLLLNTFEQAKRRLNNSDPYLD